ncbi:hypothetical protein JOC77_000282 [Peribacillus deserti]|uniref:Uncharacterized protein n=1 Tax=Peribacillus deserti TaxID=673318 RepID=A0ABS2QCL7_9BACI|nr:hypothetical protein [Peribacillus deserti]MBM7690879.1 hypothetical protein [Peribacillus deserti]
MKCRSGPRKELGAGANSPHHDALSAIYTGMTASAARKLSKQMLVAISTPAADILAIFYRKALKPSCIAVYNMFF